MFPLELREHALSLDWVPNLGQNPKGDGFAGVRWTLYGVGTGGFPVDSGIRARRSSLSQPDRDLTSRGQQRLGFESNQWTPGEAEAAYGAMPNPSRSSGPNVPGRVVFRKVVN